VATRSVSGRRYADAIFELALEAGTLDNWRADLRTITEFVSDGDVARLLGSGRVPRGEKTRLLTAALQPSISPLAWNLVRMLDQRGKVTIAPDILAAYEAKVDDSRNVAHAIVTTAVPLADDERAAVAAKLSSLTGKQVDVTAVVDEAIIGGVIARVGDQLIDASTRSRLVALKRRLEGAAR
jgi:F-type H+-transporting ATPase subunit delta